MNNINVLVIEDDPMVAEVNKGLINSVVGFRVIFVAKTGAEGIKAVDNLNPDLTMLDVYLPDINGVDVLKEIRKIGSGTDVILVTAAQDAETIQNVFRYGAVDYIIKPFKFDRLKAALESYVMLRKNFNSKSSFNQADLDKITQQKGVISSEQSTPKGLNDITMKQIIMYLAKNNDRLSAEEVAEGLGLARVTARRYLEYLEETGRVSLELQYGSVGRPIKRYKTK